MLIDSFTGKYRFLSNFEGSRTMQPTAEHHYQAAKTLIGAQRSYVLDAPTPGEAKRRGRTVTMRQDWDTIKNDVMWQVLLIKFSDWQLRELLWRTHPSFLIEGNRWHDNYWGSCVCRKCASLPKHNNLGKMLMRMRDAWYNTSTPQEACHD